MSGLTKLTKQTFRHFLFSDIDILKYSIRQSCIVQSSQGTINISPHELLVNPQYLQCPLFSSGASGHEENIYLYTLCYFAKKAS